MKGNRSTEEVEAIYHRHIKMVYQICLMLMKNVPDAEDAAQTVFRKVMEYPKPFRDPEHEKAWLIVTAREAAEIMGKNPSTVRTWLAQGRKKLKEVLEVEYHG